jgi:type 1 glutamine amidotransferase
MLFSINRLSCLLVFLLALVSTCDAANIVIMAVEEPDNYDAVNSMNAFAANELRPQGHQVTVVVGDKPVKHHFEGLVAALKDADLLILFSRRRFLPKEQMDAVRAHLNAGKPLLGIRTANHAFIPRPKDTVDAGLTIWPEFTHDVLGGENAGYETKGLPYIVSVPAGIKTLLLEGVNAANIRGYQSLYKVLPLAADATPVLIGTAGAGASTPPQPVAWTRAYGPGKARIFYTSLGAPEDMRIEDVRRLLVNAVKWSLSSKP